MNQKKRNQRLLPKKCLKKLKKNNKERKKQKNLHETS